MYARYCSGRVWFGLDDLVVTSPAGVLPQATHVRSASVGKGVRGRAVSTTRVRVRPRPLRRLRWKSRAGRSRSGFRTPPPAAAHLPCARTLGARARPSNAGLPNITATGGWMDASMSPSKIPGRSRVVSLVMRRSRAYCAGWGEVEVSGARLRNGTGCHPTGPEFLARTDPPASLQGTGG